MAGTCALLAACFSGIREKIREWWSYYFYWSWSALFASGLYFGSAFVDYSFLGFLILLIKQKTRNLDLRHNVLISNAQDLFQALLATVLIYSAEERIRPFYMILITYASFIAGILMLFLFPKMNVGMIYLALAPLTVGKAGEGFIDLFLFKQFQLEKKEEDKEKVWDRINVWRFIARFLGSTASNIWLFKVDPSWKQTFRYSAVVTGTAFVFFCSGFKYYSRLSPSSSSHQREHSQGSLFNRKSSFFSSKGNSTSNIQVRQEITSSSSTKSHNTKSRLFLRKLPLWTPFVVYYVVAAAGSTFFVEGIEELNNHIGHLNVPRPEFSLLVIQKCTNFIAWFLADVLIKIFCSDDNQKRRVRLVRTILGICACFGCCIVASHFVTHRLDLIKIYPDDDPISMSFVLLAPQFSLLGIAGGLLEEELTDFFYFYAPASMHHFELAFSKAVDAVGRLIAVVLILVFQNWIRHSIDTSRLDYYYRMLALLCLCALVIFLIFFNDRVIEKIEDDKLDDEVEAKPESFTDDTINDDAVMVKKDLDHEVDETIDPSDAENCMLADILVS